MTDTTSFPSDQELDDLVNNPFRDTDAIYQQTALVEQALETGDIDPDADQLPEVWEWLTGTFWSAREGTGRPLTDPGKNYMVPLRHLGSCPVGFDGRDEAYWALSEDGEYLCVIGEVIAQTLAAGFDALSLPGTYALVLLGKQHDKEPILEINLVGLSDQIEVAAQVARVVGATEIVDCSQGLLGK